jgi:hypothetical protein
MKKINQGDKLIEWGEEGDILGKLFGENFLSNILA